MIAIGEPVLILDLDRTGVVVRGGRQNYGLQRMYEVSLSEPMRDGGTMIKSVFRRESLLCPIAEKVPEQKPPRTRPYLAWSAT